jgi:hypothetical protein
MAVLKSPFFFLLHRPNDLQINSGQQRPALCCASLLLLHAPVSRGLAAAGSSVRHGWRELLLEAAVLAVVLLA